MPLVFGRSIFGFVAVSAPPVSGWDVSDSVYYGENFSVATQGTNATALFFKDDGTKMYVATPANNNIHEYTLSTAWDVSSASHVDSLDIGTEETAIQTMFIGNNGSKLFVTGNSGDDVNEYDLSPAWDLSTASFVDATSIAGQSTNPFGIFFKSDGTKMYAIELFGGNVFQYSLTAWDASTLSYDSVSFNTGTPSGENRPQGLHFKPDGTQFFVVGRNDDVHQFSLTTAWDISTASYDSILFDVSGQETDPEAVFFKPDGTKMYTVGATNNTVFAYNLTSPWTDPDLSSASYDSVSFSVANEETSPTNIGFNDDGTSMYIIGRDTDAIYQYTLSTAWDLSTASYASKSLSTSGENTPRDFTFNNDGTKIYYVGDAVDRIYQYSLSTAYDISTATSDNKTTSVGSQSLRPTGIELKSDGTKLYVCDGIDDNIYQYSLSTAFDISTASYDSVSFSFSSEVTNTQSIFFSPDGTSLFVCDTTSGNDSVYKYSLSTAWDVSTLSYANESFSLAGQDDPFGVAFKSDGSKMYMVGNTSDAVYQYSTVAPAWTNPDIAAASYDSVSFSFATQDNLVHDIAFKDDGTKMYIIGAGNDSVFQYSLSTAWDVSTASYDSVSLSVNSEEGTPTSLFFKPDGSKFYIAGISQDTVFQYSMSTSWDLSTASYESKSFSVATEESSPRDVAFKTDGTKMYITGVVSDRIDEYSLSTAWDVSTASHTTNFSVASQEGNPQSLFFNPDGSKVWIVGGSNNTAFQYSLSTAWDISTASYDSVSFSVSSQMAAASGIEFKSDGSKMYVCDLVNDVVYQYST